MLQIRGLTRPAVEPKDPDRGEVLLLGYLVLHQRLHPRDQEGYVAVSSLRDLAETVEGVDGADAREGGGGEVHAAFGEAELGESIRWGRGG